MTVTEGLFDFDEQSDVGGVVSFGIETGRSGNIEFEIEPEFKALIPPLSADEYQQLEAKVKKIEEKMDVLRKVARIVGIDLDDVIGKGNSDAAKT